MKYTLAGGVNHRNEDINRGLLVSLPIIAGLLFLSLLGARHIGQHPVTGPAYSDISNNSKQSAAKKPAGTSANSPNTTGGVGSGSAPSPAVAAATTQPSTSSVVSSGGSSTTLTGGRGGGGGVSGAGTVVCTNSPGSLVPLTCTACSPPVVLAVGQKAILQADGTCALAN
jgi:hypothetical protein